MNVRDIIFLFADLVWEQVMCSQFSCIVFLYIFLDNLGKYTWYPYFKYVCENSSNLSNNIMVTAGTNWRFFSNEYGLTLRENVQLT